MDRLYQRVARQPDHPTASGMTSNVVAMAILSGLNPTTILVDDIVARMEQLWERSKAS
jgi:hypothetical protein